MIPSCFSSRFHDTPEARAILSEETDNMAPGRPTPASLSELTKLKAAQLHQIAAATGVKSSGGKPVLAQRLIDQLYRDGLLDTTKTKTKTEEKQSMSILSIDMGIRNLAYAHIIVPSRDPVAARRKSGFGKDGKARDPLPILNAWTRLAVSALPAPTDTDVGTHADPSPAVTPGKEQQPSLEEDQINALSSAQYVGIKETFSPDVYATHAYSLVTSLLSTYKPTHILIERQRFRSGGSSQVQEWSLRVGIFEAMIYAVLNTLREEGRIKALAGNDVIVEGVTPRRVAMYWEDEILKCASGRRVKKSEGENGEEEETSTGTKTRAIVGKEGKLSLVAGWWFKYFEFKHSQGVHSEPLKVSVQENSPAEDIVYAYLRKWIKADSPPVGIDDLSERPSSLPRMEKRDDLADCLLQGLAWLEWSDMRKMLVREGPEAVSSHLGPAQK